MNFSYLIPGLLAASAQSPGGGSSELEGEI